MSQLAQIAAEWVAVFFLVTALALALRSMGKDGRSGRGRQPSGSSGQSKRDS